jgi:hypothetical protein
MWRAREESEENLKSGSVFYTAPVFVKSNGYGDLLRFIQPETEPVLCRLHYGLGVRSFAKA